MSVTNIATFAIAVLTQLAAIALLPRTNGFTQLVPTLLCSALFVIGIGALARLAHGGVELGILIPMMSEVIPLVTIVIGVVVYGETLHRSSSRCSGCRASWLASPPAARERDRFCRCPNATINRKKRYEATASGVSQFRR